MKTFSFEIEATRRYFADVEIEADSQEEADKKLKDYLLEVDAGGGDELKWNIEDSEYRCEEVDERAKEREAQQEGYAEVVIHVYASSEGDWMYDIYKGSPNEENDDSIDGGCCTGRFCDALEMASDQADAQYRLGKLT